MTEKKFSPFFRPLIASAAFMMFFFGYLAMKGRDTNPAKLMLVGSWFLIGAVAVGLTQTVRKKEFGWLANSVGVVAVGMLVAVVMLALDR